MTEHEWIQKVAPDAVYCARKYGYPASALIGQTCQETGYGTTKLVEYNNVIGMKTTLLPYTSTVWPSSTYPVNSVIKGTWEEVNGERVDKDDSFRIYVSIRDCLEDYCLFMRDGELAKGVYKYRHILAWKDPEKVLRFITGKYATDRTYADKVLNIIEKHDLTQYDKEAYRVHYISNCGHDENGQYSGGVAGDQTGSEYQIKEWYSRPWDVVFEPPTKAIGDTTSELAIEAANNDLIGYDQGNRTSFDAMLIKYGNYPKNIKKACETDCSAADAAIVRAVGRILGIPALQNVSKDAYTGNLEAALTAAGFIAHRESKYTDSPDYIGNGWILLCTGHHTAISVSTGSKWEDEKMSEVRILKKGMHGEDVEDLQAMLTDLGYCDCQDYLNIDGFIDGDFGDTTERYLRCFQRYEISKGNQIGTDGKPDGVYGPLTRAALIKAHTECNYDKFDFTAAEAVAAGIKVGDLYKSKGYKWNSAEVAPWLQPWVFTSSCDRGMDHLFDVAGICLGNREAKGIAARLQELGAKKLTDVSQIQAGDVIILNTWHIFMAASSRTSSGTYQRIDFGSDDRMKHGQPHIEPITDVLMILRPPYKGTDPEPETEESGKLYQVQAGLYEVKANAERQVERLKAAGFDALINVIDE